MQSESFATYDQFGTRDFEFSLTFNCEERLGVNLFLHSSGGSGGGASV